MKKLITILLFALFAVNTIQAQTISDFEMTSIQITQKNIQDIQDINLRLEKYHQQNRTGNTLILAGIFSAIAGSAIIYGEYNSVATITTRSTVLFGATLCGIGAGLTSAGWVLNLNSHNRLKRK